MAQSYYLINFHVYSMLKLLQRWGVCGYVAIFKNDDIIVTSHSVAYFIVPHPRRFVNLGFRELQFALNILHWLKHLPIVVTIAILLGAYIDW